MIGKKIIIDGLYQDDTTVVLCKNGVIEELRHQNATQNFIQGNIYLARIEKIEPALQAAFVNYGHGKSGFLKFSDIHPKYYDANANYIAQKDNKNIDTIETENEASVKQIHKELVNQSFQRPMSIHNLIKVDQKILVQIEKDERGSKGASLTTFLSLSGRYCVLLLNSTKANIISKTVEDEEERQRLKNIASDLCMMQDNISVMLKPSAAYKTKVEITRDFGYLLRLWNNIQKYTDSAEAPLFIHEEGDIIKKSIRDLYAPEVDEIIVAGKDAYENAYSFMKLLMPKYLNKIKYYKKPQPIFIEYNIHEQIKSLYSDNVSLPSGGYLVINQTEALTSIDVNSGRSKGDSSIDETANRINLEAAHHIIQQIKLRNISGLIVIDFIDMLSQDSRDTIENIIKEGLASQSTRALVSKISEFGLLQISRQRLGNSLNECVFHRCRECNGKGRVRSFELTAIAILKAISEEIAISNETDASIEIGARKEIVTELINERKKELFDIEKMYGVKINLKIDELATLDTFFIERRRSRAKFYSSALSSIDKTYYFSDENANKKVQHKTHNSIEKKAIPILQSEMQKSFIRKFFERIFRKF